MEYGWPSRGRGCTLDTHSAGGHRGTVFRTTIRNDWSGQQFPRFGKRHPVIGDLLYSSRRHPILTVLEHAAAPGARPHPFVPTMVRALETGRRKGGLSSAPGGSIWPGTSPVVTSRRSPSWTHSSTI